MIKNYSRFINENSNMSLEDALLEVTSLSYSQLCKIKKETVDDRFKKILNDIKDYGWTLERIKKEFTDNQINDLYAQMISENGEVDVFFYKLFEKFGLPKEDVYLGGEGWEDIYVNPDEAFIRYSYGYHETEYGKLLIDRLDGGFEEFKSQAIKYFKDWIYEELPYQIPSIYKKYNIDLPKITKSSFFNGALSTKIIDNLDEFFITEEDRIIIFANDLANYLNNLKIREIISKVDDKKLSDYFELTSKHIYEKIKNMMSYPVYDIIDFTGTDIVIWSDI